MNNKCLECGAEMVGEYGRHEYTALPGTVLEVPIYRCPECGEEEVEIPAIGRLNRALAEMLITQPRRLVGHEIRFLRKCLGWSGVDFARHMGVKKETVSRWERGAAPIGAQTERLLRLSVRFVTPTEQYEAAEVAELEELLDIEHAEPQAEEVVERPVTFIDGKWAHGQRMSA